MNDKGYVVLTYEFGRDGRRWTAHCKELGTATFGRSLPEAKNRLMEAVVLNLNALEDVGERKNFFREHNIEFHETKPKSVTISMSTDEASFIQPHIQQIPEYSFV